MVNYYKVKESVKRECYVKDGYFGDTIKVGIAFSESYAMIVHDHGCHKANSRVYQDEAEMLYYYDNHANVHFPQVTRKINS